MGNLNRGALTIAEEEMAEVDSPVVMEIQGVFNATIVTSLDTLLRSAGANLLNGRSDLTL